MKKFDFEFLTYIQDLRSLELICAALRMVYKQSVKKKKREKKTIINSNKNYNGKIKHINNMGYCLLAVDTLKLFLGFRSA